MPELAGVVGKSRQTVEYRIGRMVKSGLIRSFSAAFNPHKLGFGVHKLYLKLRNIPEQREKLIEELLDSGMIWWLGECSGSWDLIVAFFSSNNYQFFYTKNEILSKFSEIIVNKETATFIDASHFPKMYFTREQQPSVFAGGKVMPNKLDEIEFSLLREIVENARTPVSRLADKYGVSPTMIRSKLKKLEQKGIVIQYRINVDVSKLDFEMYKALVRYDRYTREDEREIQSYISQIPNIQYLIRHISSVELEFVVESNQQYFDIIEDLKKKFPYFMADVDTVMLLNDNWTPGFKAPAETAIGMA